MSKEIQLTMGQVAIVDDSVYEEENRYKWRAKWSEYTQSYYAVRWSEGGMLHRKVIQMHREIMNTPNGMLCDHVNHNTLDNQKHNLRNVTHSQNGMNRRGANSNNSLGEKCISRQGKGFEVRVSVGGKCIFDKWFKTLPEAITARNKAVKHFHGEFAASDSNNN